MRWSEEWGGGEEVGGFVTQCRAVCAESPRAVHCGLWNEGRKEKTRQDTKQE